MADLGLATFKTVITGTVCGTPLYMAPEILKLKIYDSKVDMYSFGLMMWEMWFGETASRELSSRSQEYVFRQTERKRLCGEGRRVKFYPPSRKWIKLMLSCCNSDPGLRKTATESKDLMKELQIKPFEEEVQ